MSVRLTEPPEFDPIELRAAPRNHGSLPAVSYAEFDHMRRGKHD